MCMNSSLFLPQFYYEILFVKVRTHVIMWYELPQKSFQFSLQWSSLLKLKTRNCHRAHCSLFSLSLFSLITGSRLIPAFHSVMSINMEAFAMGSVRSSCVWYWTLICWSWIYNLQSMLLRNSPLVWAMSICQVAKALNFSSFPQINKIICFSLTYSCVNIVYIYLECFTSSCPLHTSNWFIWFTYLWAVFKR